MSYTDLDIPTYQTHRENDYDHTLVDVRELWEFGMGHIPGALHIPLNDLPDRVGEIPPDKPVVLVCEHGIRSVMAAQFVAQQGHEGVYNLMGGTSEWRLRGLPLARS